jgi:competence protein ComEC
MLAGAAVLLAWNPYALLDPGFQLSFSAVAAIFLGVARLGGRLEGYPIPPRVAEVLAVSVVCGVATAPVLLWQFGYVPVYSVPANVLVAPAVAPLLVCGLASAAVEPVAPALCAQLAWAEGLLAAYIATVARVVSGLPYARLGPAGLLTAACLGVMAAVGLRRLAAAQSQVAAPSPD